MRRVFSRSGRAVAVWLLLIVLIAPRSFASDAAQDPGLWAEFVAWIELQIGGPGGVAVADNHSFVVWLAGRITVPGG